MLDEDKKGLEQAHSDFQHAVQPVSGDATFTEAPAKIPCKIEKIDEALLQEFATTRRAEEATRKAYMECIAKMRELLAP